LVSHNLPEQAKYERRYFAFHPSKYYRAMATNEQPDTELNRPTDPAQLGADQAPATGAADDAHDMSTVVADAATGRDDAAPAPTTATQQGSDFDQQRQQGAAGNGDSYGTVGRSQGMGHTADTGDEDRGYDQSSYRGGLGASGGREDLSERNPDPDHNPFTGGYGGGPSNQPADAQAKNVGLDSDNQPAKSDQ
jgi:hypothetical protein